MKNLMLTLGLLGWMTISSWAQNDYLQWETHRYYAKPGQAENFEKGLAAHNKKFHSAAPYKTSIFHVRTGPNSGCYELVMGPMTFTQMEGRPTGDDHDNDWEKNVLAYAEPIGETIYWRADKDLQYNPAGSEAYDSFRWRYNNILPGQADRYEEMINKVIAVFKAKNLKGSFATYWRWGASQGPHACTELGMDSFAYFDQYTNWEKDFEEVHGEGSFKRFGEDLDMCIDRTKSYDELATYDAELSSPR